jgi:hypothetical protein
MSGLASLYGRSGLADKLPPVANVAISNVPGPSFALYFAGAKVAAYFPVSIPGHGLALNMTVQSYNGALEFGLTACRRAVPDVADLGDYVVAEHKKLFGLIAGKAAQAEAAAPADVPVAAPAAAAVPKPPAKKRAAPKLAAKKKVTAKAVRPATPKAGTAARKPTATKRATALN